MYVAVALALCVVMHFLFKGFWSGSADIDVGVDRVKVNIQQAENLNQSITDGLSTAQREAGDITAGIGRAEDALSEASAAAGRIGRNLEESSKLLDDCERIIRAVEARNEAKAENT